MKKTVSAHVYNTIERYPQILKTPKVEKAMRNLKCWMALGVNRGFDNSSYIYIYSTYILYIDYNLKQAGACGRRPGQFPRGGGRGCLSPSTGHI